MVYVLFALMQKRTKRIKANPPRQTAGFVGPTHMKSLKVCKKHFAIELIVRTCCSMLFETHKGAVFFVYKLQGVTEL